MDFLGKKCVLDKNPFVRELDLSCLQGKIVALLDFFGGKRDFEILELCKDETDKKGLGIKVLSKVRLFILGKKSK